MSSSESTIKQTHQNNFGGYNLVSTLYTYDEINIIVENTITKHKYQFSKVAKEILELTQKSKFEMEAEQLYNLYITSVNQKNDNVKLIMSTDVSNNLLLTISWTIHHEEIKLTRTFELICQTVHQTDTERMEKMFIDFVKQKEKLEQLAEDLKKMDLNKKFTDVYDYVNSESDRLIDRQMKRMDNKMDDLKTEVNEALNMVTNDMANQGQNNLINVTVFADVYKSTDTDVFNMIVDKKSKMSKLFITAQIGLPNRLTVHLQTWTFGRKSQTTTTSPLQSPAGRNVPLLCMGMIVEHYETGPQTLTLTLPGTKLPFNNTVDNTIFLPYCVVKVEEIM